MDDVVTGAAVHIPTARPAPTPALHRQPGPAVVTVRPVEPEDAGLIVGLGTRLSVRTRYLRFFSPLRTLPEPLLTHLVVVDHADREALAAVVDGQFVGVARYDRVLISPDVAEIAVVIADDWQRHGLASRLLLELSSLAVQRGIRSFTASTLVDNRATIRLLRQIWPTARGQYADGVYNYRLPLPVGAPGIVEG
jgi:RimJ/RimL family protein N-acetyltransferase